MNPPATTPKRPSRDSVTTINEDGSRYFIHPADVSGRFTTLRRFTAWFLLAVYITLPWIPIGGHPAVFLDFQHGQFHLFGSTFVAQDLFMLFFLITGLGFSLFFITSILGRVWCGWACPQTVFMEQIFRAIERRIEGDGPARRALDLAPPGFTKLLKRVTKHSLYILLSLAIAHLFIAYFTSLPALYVMMRHSPTDNFTTFAFVFGLSGVLYFNFAWFREQFCIVLCPYGRFQSALIDEHSLVIGYDEKRGEPRGKPGKEGAGDCIDCRRCVQVCPTGIDIRQGLQLECIGCSNCIDACDAVMEKLHRPRGLVRYDSQAAFAGGKTRWLRPRLVLYAVLFAFGATALTLAASRVTPVSASVTRLPGIPYVLADGTIRNNFTVRIINKKHLPATFTVTTAAAGVTLQQIGLNHPVTVPAEGEVQETMVLLAPRANFPGPVTVTVTLQPDGGKPLQKRVDFLGPKF